MAIWLPEIDVEQCTACGLCVEQCPTKAVAFVSHIATITEPENCTYCGLCEELCPTNAVSLAYEISTGLA